MYVFDKIKNESSQPASLSSVSCAVFSHAKTSNSEDVKSKNPECDKYISPVFSRIAPFFQNFSLGLLCLLLIIASPFFFYNTDKNFVLKDNSNNIIAELLTENQEAAIKFQIDNPNLSIKTFLNSSNPIISISSSHNFYYHYFATIPNISTQTIPDISINNFQTKNIKYPKIYFKIQPRPA